MTARSAFGVLEDVRADWACYLLQHIRIAELLGHEPGKGHCAPTRGDMWCREKLEPVRACSGRCMSEHSVVYHIAGKHTHVRETQVWADA